MKLKLALIILLIGVAAGLVDGVMAATTPTGFAISIIPFFLSLLITPTVLIFFKSLKSPSVFLLFFVRAKTYHFYRYYYFLFVGSIPVNLEKENSFLFWDIDL